MEIRPDPELGGAARSQGRAAQASVVPPLQPPAGARVWVALGGAFVASALAAWTGASAASTGDVGDGLVVAVVGLGLLVWAAVWAGTLGGTPAGGYTPGSGPPRPPAGVGSVAMVLASLLVRLPWLRAAPIFSDDVYRYVWEGRVWAAGFNPFAHAPIDPVLTPLRDALWAKVNHPEVSSIYPPLAQLLFVLLAPGGVLAWKLLGTAADCATGWLLGRRSSRSGWLWALLPLTALESAGSGHLESVGVLLLVLALSQSAAGRTRSAIAAAWAGAMVKLLPGAALLPLVRGWKARLVIVAATGIAMAPILAAGHGAFAGFETYRAVWAFDGSAYPLLVEAFSHTAMTGDPARKLLQVVGAAWVGIVVWRTRDRVHAPFLVAMAATAAFVLLSPTVHPWYVLWPLAVGLWGAGGGEIPGSSRTAASSMVWVLAAVLVPFAYRVLGTLHAGVWHEEVLTRWVIWAPVWAALVAGVGVSSWSRRGARTT